MQSWDNEVDHLKDYLYPESYLLDVLSHNHLLGIFAKFLHQIFPLIISKISPCDEKHTNYHANQVTLISPHPNRFHTFTVLASVLRFCDDHDACALFHQLQVGVLSCLTHNKLGSLIQSVRTIVQKFSLFMSNWESGVSTDWSYFSSILGGCHAVYHFPNNTPNDSRFVHYDLHRVTSFFLDFCQASEALRHALMAMAGPHYLDITNKNDQIYLSISNSHHDPLS